MLFGSSRPRASGLVATPEQEAETARLEELMQQRMPAPSIQVAAAQQALQPPPMGWGEKVGGIGTALMAAQAAIDGDFSSGAEIANSIGADRRRMQQTMAQRAAEREAQMQDWVAKQEWERAHPEPVNNDTKNDYEFILQQQGPEAAANYLKRVSDPDVTVPLPNGQVYIGPRSGMQVALGAGGSAQAPVKPIGKLTPLGGGASNGVGGFPR